jgi:EAL domain-containing protein (putative c-di-GMP-specific phosphodiesterase class I)/ActR/RegA family two-component response regulator
MHMLATAEASLSDAALPESTPGDDARTILIVEDLAPLRTLYARLLRRAGFLVDTADSAAEARARLGEGNTYAAVVSDLWLPDGMALEIIPSLRAGDPDAPFLVITAQPTVDTAIDAIERGVHRYLTKPINPDRFVAEVREAARICAVSRLRREVAPPRPVARVIPLPNRHLDEALGSLWLAAQPIVRMSTRSIYAHEVLFRSNCPSLPTPLDVISEAERSDRLFELGRAVRRAAALRASELPPGQRLFVNLHPDDVIDPSLHSDEDPLRPYADRITLEVTERARLDGMPGVDDALRRLRDAGFQIAIDDLGAGYSGLSSLANLAPHVAKLDMSLVRGIDRDPKRVTLVRAMVEVCRELGCEVVAEGIETAAERDVLLSLGCDLLQGYFFARPGVGFPTVSPLAFP